MQSLWARRFVAICAILALMLGLAACGGVSDTTIPAPPGGTEVKEGSDQTLDVLIQALKPAFSEAISNEKGNVDKQAFYTSTSSVADVAKFYDDAMKKNGWDALTDNSTQPTMAALGYSSGNKGAVIFITDTSSFGGSG